MAETAGTETTEVAPSTETTAPAIKTAEWYESELSKVRNEAASQRVKKGEAVKAKEAELTAAFQTQLAESANALETVKTEAATHAHELAKIKAALAAKVPSDKVLAFASKLNGSTPEELAADAEETKKLFGGFNEETPATDPSQGRGGSGAASDPGAAEFAAFIKKSLS
jgi:hypothetical protein